jgi:hypothetical protein
MLVAGQLANGDSDAAADICGVPDFCYLQMRAQHAPAYKRGGAPGFERSAMSARVGLGGSRRGDLRTHA